MKKADADVKVVSQSEQRQINMFHGIYVKSKPKGKWHLVSIAFSAEVANNDVIEYKKQVEIEGNISAEVAIQTFDSGFYIPELLSQITTQKLMYN